MKLTRKTWLAIVAGAMLASPAAVAADHNDGTQAKADPAADITDVYAWMTDANHLALIMNVMPNAGTTGQFSDAVKYVFHTTTWSAYFTPTTDAEIDVICTFDSSQNPSCWVNSTDNTVGNNGLIDYVSGTAAAAAGATGITSASGDIQLFAGSRNDPFFFNLAGFQTTVADVVAAVPALLAADAGAPTYAPNGFNAAGCPNLAVLPGGASATSAALLGQLGANVDGGVAVDNFEGQDVLSIVLNININSPSNPNGQLLQTGNTLLSVWASTNN